MKVVPPQCTNCERRTIVLTHNLGLGDGLITEDGQRLIAKSYYWCYSCGTVMVMGRSNKPDLLPLEVLTPESANIEIRLAT